MHSDNANGRFRRNPVAPTRVGERTGFHPFETLWLPLENAR
jgi:hypothetical protein